MSGKYSHLPDIDLAPDVFETPDEPEPSQRRDEDGSEDARKPAASTQDIDSSDLPSRRQAVKVFRGSDATVLTPPPRETQLARLRRLQAEVAELESELRDQPDGSRPPSSPKKAPTRRSVISPRPPVDMVTELSILREKLNLASDDTSSSAADLAHAGDNWQNRLQRLGEPHDGTVATLGKDVDEPSSVSRTNVLSGDVDKRLAALEQLVGMADRTDQGNNSLAETLNRLDHLLTVFTQPRHLDSISRRIKLLLVDLERATAASRRSGTQPPGADRAAGAISPGDLEALQSLFALLPRLDPLIPVIPPLLTRLRSLSGLHAEALGIAADLRELQSADRNVTEEQRELASIVASIQQGVTEAAGSISKNWESLQARVKALEKANGM